ncbi:MAG: hypothetical protein U1E15_07325 [Hyphomicrobiales bacterium]
MLTPLAPELSQTPDVAHGARRFRVVLRSFERNLDLLFRGTALEPHVDHAALATAFANWRERFDATKRLAGLNRRDYTIYAAGLMLKELIAAAPLKTSPRGEGAPAVPAVAANHALSRWPEGYAYTSFCLSMVDVILKEMGEDEPHVPDESNAPAFWDSFRENVTENPAAAVAFFDLVCGREPNWDAPDVPWLRKAFAGAGLLGQI